MLCVLENPLFSSFGRPSRARAGGAGRKRRGFARGQCARRPELACLCLGGVELVLQPVLHGVGRHEHALEPAEFLVEISAELFRERVHPQVFRSFGIAHHKAQGGVFAPVVEHEIMGEVVLGADGGVFGVPVVVAPFKVQGHGVGRSVPLNSEAIMNVRTMVIGYRDELVNRLGKLVAINIPSVKYP